MVLGSRTEHRRDKATGKGKVETTVASHFLIMLREGGTMALPEPACRQGPGALVAFRLLIRGREG